MIISKISENNKTARPLFVLASASPRRLSLLAQIDVVPDQVIAADLDETPFPTELPKPHALRLAGDKASAIWNSMANNGSADAFVLAADTVVGVGRRILPKAEGVDTARTCLELLSGRSHRVFTGVCLITPNGQKISRVVETRLKMKRLTLMEIQRYLDSGEWSGKAGGYGIQGMAESYISQIIGSYSNVVGLPLYETRNILIGAGCVTKSVVGKG